MPAGAQRSSERGPGECDRAGREGVDPLRDQIGDPGEARGEVEVEAGAGPQDDQHRQPGRQHQGHDDRHQEPVQPAGPPRHPARGVTAPHECDEQAKPDGDGDGQAGLPGPAERKAVGLVSDVRSDRDRKGREQRRRRRDHERPRDDGSDAHTSPDHPDRLRGRPNDGRGGGRWGGFHASPPCSLHGAPFMVR